MLSFIGGYFNAEATLPNKIFSIPIVALVGGITASNDKQMTEAKLIENSQRELKLSLMRAGWQPDWGDRAAFETWVLDRRAPPPSRTALALWDAR